MQVLHFCYGLGAFVSPMIAEPFLLNEDCSLFIDNDTSSYGADLVSAAEGNQRTADLASLDLNATINLLPAKSLVEAQQMTKVRYAFWIMAALMVRTTGLVVEYRTRNFHVAGANLAQAICKQL